MSTTYRLAGKIALAFSLLISSKLFSQNVGINATGANADASAMLDINSATKGLLIPRMTTAEQNAISSPANGLIIFNTTLNTIMMNTGTSIAPVWTAIVAGTITNSAPITYSSGAIGITQSGTGSNGYLSSTDWNTFNNKADVANVWLTAGNAVTAVQKLGTTSNYDLPFYTNNTEQMRLSTGGKLGLGISTPLAVLHLKAGTSAATTAPLKFTSGTLLTIPEIGAVEFLSDKFYGTITTSAVRKELTLNDIGLTSGRIPYATTNGRLTDVSTLTYSSGRLSPKYITLSAGTAAVGTAPLLFSSGPLLTTPTGGALEFDGTHFYGTVGSTRYQLDQQSFTNWTTTGNSGTTYGTNFLGTTDNVSLSIKTYNTERMVVTKDGNVGIGTSSFDATLPEKLLVDAGTNPSNGATINSTPINAIGASNGFQQIQVQNRAYGNYSSSDLVAASDGTRNGTVPINTDAHYVDLGINSSGYTNSNSNILNQQYTAYLYSTTPQAFYIGNGYQGKDIIFFTNYSSTNSNNTADGFEIMRLYGGTSQGTQQVTIGNISPNGSNRLTVNGSISASAFNTSSDRRLKTNIENLGYGLGEIMALQPSRYNWKTTPDKDKQLGLIAQDVKKVVPEIVSGDEVNGTLSINYTALIPVLINAVKEQQTQIEELKKKIEFLERKTP